jgi:mRNA interferase MazF
MEKDFDAWNGEKKHIHAHQEYAPLYHEREIRWCQLGLNIGFEQDGTGNKMSRPVLVLRAFSRHVCIVIPLTTSEKKNPYHVAIGTVGGRKACAIISQLRLIDTKRLDQKIAMLDKETFEGVRKAVKDIL